MNLSGSLPVSVLPLCLIFICSGVLHLCNANDAEPVNFNNNINSTRMDREEAFVGLWFKKRFSCIDKFDAAVEAYKNTTQVPEIAICCGVNLMKACIRKQIDKVCTTDDDCMQTRQELLLRLLKRSLISLAEDDVDQCLGEWYAGEDSPLCWRWEYKLMVLGLVFGVLISVLVCIWCVVCRRNRCCCFRRAQRQCEGKNDDDGKGVLASLDTPSPDYNGPTIVHFASPAAISLRDYQQRYHQ